MASKIKLSNSQGKTLSVTNSDLLTTDKDVIYLDTVAQLTLATGTNGDVAHVSESGRGGIFIYDSTATDNQGTIFGKWVRQYEGAVNVKWFGAVGDGAADDTIAMQDTLDVSSSVFIPEGTYRHNGTLISSSNSLIYGEGNNTVLKVLDSSIADAWGIKINTANGVVIRDIHLDGNVSRLTAPFSFSGGVYGSGLLIQNSKNVLAHNVKSVNWAKHCFDVSANTYSTGNAATYVTGSRSENVLLYNCYAKNGNDDNFTTHQSDYIVIDGCISEDTGGLYVQNNSNCYEVDDGSRYVTVTNSIARNGVCGVQIKGHSDSPAPKGIIVSNMQIEGCNYGIDAYNTSFYGDGDGGYSTTAYDLTIQNIVISSAQEWLVTGEEAPFFIRVRSYANVTIDNIHILDSAITYSYGGISLVSGVRNVNLTNVFFKNTTYAYGIRATATCTNVNISNVKAVDCSGTSLVYISDTDVHSASDVSTINTTGEALQLTTANIDEGAIVDLQNYKHQVGADSIGGVVTTRPTLSSYGWVEGNQNLGEGEGVGIAFTAKLIGDSSSSEVARITSHKASGTDTTRTSSIVVETSSTGNEVNLEQSFWFTFNGTYKSKVFTVATLPTAAGVNGAGQRSFVSDATAITFATAVVGGGANGVPVYSDGANWRIG